MPLTHRRRAAPRNTTATTRTRTKPTLMQRLRGTHGHAHTTRAHHGAHTSHHHTPTTTTTTTTTTKREVHTQHGGATHHHQHRKTSVGDKFSGAMMKLRGSVTRRPGLKAAGTRRMRGTDGRGSHRY